MQISVAILSVLVSICSARPSEDRIIPKNVITVPPNCPAGQELVNGQCREIWSWQNNINAANLGVLDPSNRNVITVPTNCPPGQEFINGQCRDIWRFGPTTPISPYKVNAPSDQEEIGKRQAEDQVAVIDTLELVNSINRNIVSVPNQCPSGYRPDALGVCRPMLG